jgi:hypothetical protein
LSEPPAPLVQWDSVGSHLRRWYGEDYRSIGFTFDHGTVNVLSNQPPYEPQPVAVPRPEPDWGDRPLGDANLDQSVLDLRADAPPAVRAWRQAATKVRAVGSFDPQRPDAYYMTGGSLAQWFDVIVHRQTVTPWRPSCLAARGIEGSDRVQSASCERATSGGGHDRPANDPLAGAPRFPAGGLAGLHQEAGKAVRLPPRVIAGSGPVAGDHP